MTLITGCETCTKPWEECCGEGLSQEEIDRVNKQVEEFYASKSGGTADTPA